MKCPRIIIDKNVLIAVLEAADYLAERASRADAKKFHRAISKAANNAPSDEDKL